jgi:RNA polymerase sigma-70 factor (family 1)
MSNDRPPEIIDLLNARKPDAIAWAYSEYYSFVFTVARKFVNSYSDTQDIVEETFEKLMRSKTQFDSVTKIKYFLYTTTKNCCLDHIRHKQLSRKKYNEWQKVSESANDENSVDEAELDGNLRKLVFDAIEELPQQQKLIFLLFFTKGLKNSEIANQLGIMKKTVSNQKSIALNKLKIKIPKANKVSIPILMTLYDYIFHIHQIAII